ncbi:MAG: hypothetical protein QXO16_01720 [Archaeoglobaceae archaeon]
MKRGYLKRLEFRIVGDDKTTDKLFDHLRALGIEVERSSVQELLKRSELGSESVIVFSGDWLVRHFKNP